MTINNKAIIVFDLDDTLINERDYLYSAYAAIAKTLAPEDTTLIERMIEKYHAGDNVFAYLEASHKASIQQLLSLYRAHKPAITAKPGAIALLEMLKKNQHQLGLITDGRSISQRNKLLAAGLNNYFDKIIISEEFGSEKPEKNNYLAFASSTTQHYIYIGDNVKKDFITPKSLGWVTICLLDNGINIHKQDFNIATQYLPEYRVKDMAELTKLLTRILSITPQ